MKTSASIRREAHPGFTLVEMSLVIFLLIALMSTGFIASRGIEDWQRGKEASETLRSVYIAQRTFLADNPTTAVNTLTEALLLPYIPNRPAAFPQVEGLDGTMRSINVTVSPPVVRDPVGTTYDPSGSPTDSLWDVGE